MESIVEIMSRANAQIDGEYNPSVARIRVFTNARDALNRAGFEDHYYTDPQDGRSYLSTQMLYNGDDKLFAFISGEREFSLAWGEDGNHQPLTIDGVMSGRICR